MNIVHTRVARSCLLCGVRTRAEPLCQDCLADLPRLPAAHCPRCALPTPGGEICGACLKRPPDFDAARAVYRYAFPLDSLLQHYKYAGELALADFMAARIAERIRAAPAPDLILPMPLHPVRLKERGFNQTVEIGRHLAARSGIPLDIDACRRVKDAPPQASLPLGERRRNIRGAFACDRDLGGLRVALLDDVMTTGASLDELARTVKKAGAASVEAWAVARTLPRR